MSAATARELRKVSTRRVANVKSTPLAGWLRVTAAAMSFPGGVERSPTQDALATGNALTWNQSTSQFHIPGVPIPKFVSLCGILVYELRNRKDTSKSMILVVRFQHSHPAASSTFAKVGIKTTTGKYTFLVEFGFDLRFADTRPGGSECQIHSTRSPGL